MLGLGVTVIVGVGDGNGVGGGSSGERKVAQASVASNNRITTIDRRNGSHL
jgi:hypothetical protein